MLDVATDPTESERIPLSPALSAEIAAEFPPAVRAAVDSRILWISLLAVGIPAGTMYTYPEAFESEHGRHRQMRMEIDHPNEVKVSNIGFAVKLTGTPQEVRRHPPLLGQHTDEVLKEIGLDSAAIDALTARGAFAS